MAFDIWSVKVEGLIGILGVTILLSLTVSAIGYMLFGNKA